MGEIDYEAPPVPYRTFLGNVQGELNAHGWPLNSTSNALEAFRIVKSGSGTLYGFSGFSNRGTAQFIHVYDALSLPADGAVPVFVMTAPTVQNFSVFWGDVGRFFQQGIVIGNSSTLATKTIGSADCWFDAQYI